MSTAVQRRRGTTAQHASFAGLNGELTVDTDKEVVVVHDGTTAGGYPQMRENGSQNLVTTGSITGGRFIPTSSTAPTNGLYLPSANSVAISTGGSGRLFVDASGNVGVGVSPSNYAGYNNLAQNGSSGSTFEQRIAGALVGSLTAAGDVSLRSVTAIPLTLHTNNTERLRITSAGLVGVGTSTFGNADADDLTVAGSGNTGITVRAGTTSASNIYFADGTTGDDAVRGYFAYNHSADRLTIGTNAATAVTIDSSQRVGIGTTSASANLHVSASSGTAIKITETNNGVTGALQATSSGPCLGSDTNHPLIFYTNAVEKARLTASGQLLVGTSSSPTQPEGQYALLVVQGYQGSSTGEGIAAIQRGVGAASLSSGNDIGRLIFNDSAGNTFAGIYCNVDATPGAGDYPGRLVFSTTADGASSPTERMRIRSDGKIQIGGTGIADARLNVVTSASERLGQFISQNTGGDAATFGLYIGKYSNDSTTTQRFIGFSINNDGSGCGQINANGSGQAAFGTFSDQRLKENIQDLPSQLGLIKALRPVEFDFKDGNGHQLGFIAQEMQQVYPDVVSEQDGYLTITGFGKTECRLIKALQEAVAKIETLEAKVAALESA